MSDDLTRAMVQSADNDAVEESPRTGSRVDDFEIGGEIARGGMGTIYRGRDLELGREVAIKILQDRFPADGSAARRFVEEAQITGQLQHPGIPPIYRAGKLADGRPYLAMKLIKGETLADRLESKSELPAKLVAIFESIAQAVGYAHERGVIHRDLKPANVMVGTYGEVQVMDWGLAKVITGEQRSKIQDPDTTRGGSEIRSLRDSGEETHAGQILGTPAYMPPEQAIGAHEQVDARSDVFGLGAILCTIMTGRPPYVGESSESTRQLAARARLDDAFAALDRSDAEPEIVALCKRCLAPEPADRPADAGVVAREVANLRSAATERAQRAEIDRAEAEVKANEERKRRRIWNRSVGAVAAVLAVGAGLSAWLAYRASQAEWAVSKQLEITRDAERKASEGEARAKDSEAKAKESEAKAKESETQERAARTEAEKQKREAKEQANSALAVKDFVCDILAAYEPGKKATPEEIASYQKATKKNLDYAVKRLDDLFDGKPATEAEIRNTIGMMYDTVGAFGDAEIQLKRSLALYEKDLGPDNVTTLHAVNALAGFYSGRGRIAEAEPLYRRSLTGFEKLTSIGPVLAIQTCRYMIVLAETQNKADVAIEYYKRGLALCERLYGPDEDDVLYWRRNMANGYQRFKMYDEAEKEYEAIAAVAGKKHGPGDPFVALNSFDLQQCYESRGKHEKVEQLLRQELESYRAALGANNSRTLNVMLRLAGHHATRENYDKSIAAYEELLELLREDVRREHPDVCHILYQAGNAYHRAGRDAEAAKVLELSERIRRKTRTLDHYRDYIYSSLESVYAGTKATDKLIALHRDRIAESRKILPANGSLLGNELAKVGKKLLELRQYTEAEAVLSDCAAIRRKLDPKAWTTFNAMSMLGGAYLGQGKLPAAGPLLIQGYEGLKSEDASIPDIGRGNVPEAIDRLAEYFERTNLPKDAAKLRAERAKFGREAAPPPRESK